MPVLLFILVIKLIVSISLAPIGYNYKYNYRPTIESFNFTCKT